MALLKTKDDIKKYISVNATIDYDNVKPYIERAESTYIKPTISVAQYNALDSSNLNSNEQTALDIIKAATAYLAYYFYLPELQVQISDQGIHIITGEHKKTAFPWQIQQLSDHWLNTGLNALEDALQFMEDNQSDFSDFVNSNAFTVYRDLFVHTADIFDSIYGIGGSRRIFQKLKPIMAQVEQKAIKHILCQDLFDDIKNDLMNDTLGGANEDLLPIIRKAVVYKTVEQAVGELAVDITSSGLTLTNMLAEGDSTKERKQADASSLMAFKENARLKGDDYLEDLRKYLNDNIDSYPLFKNSDCYDSEANSTFENDPNWAVGFF